MAITAAGWCDIVKKAIQIFSIFVFAAALAGFVWFLIPAWWHALNFAGRLGIAVCLLLMAGALFFRRILSASRSSKTARRFFIAALIIFCAGASWSFAMTCFIVSQKAQKPPESAPAIVLGSMVNGTTPSADLQARIGKASVYLKSHPGAKCIASGGQGPGENISEADAIKNALISDGIAPSRIITEGLSRTTFENLQNTGNILSKHGFGRRAAIVTDEYHEFRACSIARSLHIEPYAVPAETPWYIVSSCWAREVLALTNYFLFIG